MSKKINKVQEQQRALLDAIESMDKGEDAVAVVNGTNYNMVGDLVKRMVESIPKIAEQRKYIDWLVGEINKLPPAEPEWQPSLDVVDSIREEIDRERAMGPIPSPPAPMGRYSFLRVVRQPLPWPAIPPSLRGLPIPNNEE